MPKSTKKNPARVRPTVKAMAELQTKLAAVEGAVRASGEQMARIRSLATMDTRVQYVMHLDDIVARGLLAEVLCSGGVSDDLKARIENFTRVGSRDRRSYVARHFADEAKGQSQVFDVAKFLGVPPQTIAPKAGK